MGAKDVMGSPSRLPGSIIGRPEGDQGAGEGLTVRRRGHVMRKQEKKDLKSKKNKDENGGLP
jgi:hypothetical protein